jgi:hypothetical protein
MVAFAFEGARRSTQHLPDSIHASHSASTAAVPVVAAAVDTSTVSAFPLVPIGGTVELSSVTPRGPQRSPVQGRAPPALLA